MEHAAVLVAVMSGVTILLRALPFFLFGGRRKPPEAVLTLGRMLPGAIIGMLVVYCLRGMTMSPLSRCIPEVAGVAAVVLLQAWRRNALLSILGGTLLVMVLLRIAS